MSLTFFYIYNIIYTYNMFFSFTFMYYFHTSILLFVVLSSPTSRSFWCVRFGPCRVQIIVIEAANNDIKNLNLWVVCNWQVFFIFLPLCLFLSFLIIRKINKTRSICSAWYASLSQSFDSGLEIVIQIARLTPCDLSRILQYNNPFLVYKLGFCEAILQFSAVIDLHFIWLLFIR